MHVPQFLVFFVLRSNVDDNGENPLSDQTFDALQSQFQQTVPVLEGQQRGSGDIHNSKKCPISYCRLGINRFHHMHVFGLRRKLKNPEMKARPSCCEFATSSSNLIQV